MKFFDRERTVAGPGFSRWLVPPAALAVHLSIGQVYAFSVFKLPLTKIIGITSSAPDDWTQSQLAWIFSLAICFLGLSAAIFGRWVERVGPRKTMATAALCFGGGFIISAFGVWWHQLWIIYLGYGVLGGCGLGLGYISPVSTLVKWFPDRPGMATGMAIMGFGGGAFIGSNLSLALMDHFKSATSPGVAQAFIALGLIYFCYMMFGSFIVRVPAKDWKPAGYQAPDHPHGLDHQRERCARSSLAHSAVLAAVDRPVLQRHRRHRHSRAGVTDDSGNVWRNDYGCGRGWIRRVAQSL